MRLQAPERGPIPFNGGGGLSNQRAGGWCSALQKLRARRQAVERSPISGALAVQNGQVALHGPLRWVRQDAIDFQAPSVAGRVWGWIEEGWGKGRRRACVRCCQLLGKEPNAACVRARAPGWLSRQPILEFRRKTGGGLRIFPCSFYEREVLPFLRRDGFSSLPSPVRRLPAQGKGLMKRDDKESG